MSYPKSFTNGSNEAGNIIIFSPNIIKRGQAMTKETWYSLTLKEQLSNIHGEVKRLIRTRNNYQSGKSSQDHSAAYLKKIHDLIEITCEDPKNIRRRPELSAEERELLSWVNHEVDDDYILRYWEQYTRAIS